ncbi:MAG: HIT family protein [Crocinitomicaceae bacterium]|jgi:histidine triad (HIT) family protein|nr:HIT family protein [Crocinitomicaceae bacterium]|tara:strand:- start:25382 stop:25774 length:393 start_codon:yes stop_codon:yes gene_type:complete
MSSIFSKIIANEIPCYKIAENEFCFSFLDINPLQKGHVLVVPKKEVDQLFDLEDKTYFELFSLSKTISSAIKKSFNCNRVGMAVIGLEVPHAHVHLIPINHENDMNFSQPKKSLTSEEFESIASKIIANL